MASALPLRCDEANVIAIQKSQTFLQNINQQNEQSTE